MPLPKIATPTYELELPSTEQTIQYRPFLVKEEKVLVIALESEDTKQITTAIKSVIKNCILTKGIKVETLPTFDIEYLFLNIRGKSVGEEIEVNLVCPDDEETQVSTVINLDDIKVQKNEDHTNQIKIDKSIMMEMRYPSLEQFIKNNFDYVGENFAYEARVIHYGDKKRKKNIFGTASYDEIKELKEEGIETETILWPEDKKN